MSVWSTKSSGIDREYIVLKHKLRGVNYVINGIKFRNGYAVVEKNSKTYRFLKQIPVLRNAEEFPLIFLRKLMFITKPLDVKMVYGQDVYLQYLKQLTPIVKQEIVEIKEEKVKTHIEVENKCSFITPKGVLCKETVIQESPSKYCMKHLLQDPKLKDFGIEVPLLLKKDKHPFRLEVIDKLKKLNKNNGN